MPDERTILPFERTFSSVENEQLAKGLVPEQMEDKWFIYLEGDRLFFHRSWTGHCIFEVALEPDGDGFRVAGAWVNRNKQQYPRPDDAYDTSLLSYLIDRLLLAYDIPVPLPKRA